MAGAHALGFRLPAEWERHEATWLSWPNSRGQSFPGRTVSTVLPSMLEIVRALAPIEKVFVNISDDEERRSLLASLDAEEAKAVRLFDIPTNEPWCRDHGPTFLVSDTSSPEHAAVVWQYNGWGGKYPPWDLDNAAGARMADAIGATRFDENFVLEGGAIDGNGAGTLLASRGSILGCGRNEGVDAKTAERILARQLGVERVLWLDAEVTGDDTDGHADMIARFCAPDLIATSLPDSPDHPDYESLRKNLVRLTGERLADGSAPEIVPLPFPREPLVLPSIIDGDETVLPASYANFYLANDRVLLPVYEDANDERAVNTLTELFPGREVIPINARPLIQGLGAIHCLTQQLPALPREDRHQPST